MNDTSVLFVDDEADMREMVATHLRRRGCDVRTSSNAEEALTALAERASDVVVTDLELGGINGLDLCERIRGAHPTIPVILLTGFGSLETAVGALRAGADDFLAKPVELDELMVRANRAVQHRRLQSEVRRLRKVVSELESDRRVPGGMIGVSPVMERLFDLVRRVGPAEVTVHISGESGTGKELIARSLHENSPRRDGPFIAVNCAAMPDTLLESELFGHEKGAFTDARRPRAGLLVEASGGTLLLDEIGDMHMDMQVKLLRALQERRVRPVGGNREVEFDARILAATNCDLEAEVEKGNFREDLFYRINVIKIEAPPLRARGNDILILAQHFLERAAERSNKQVTGLSAPAAEKLMSYEWPGNVRELNNAMERAVALTRHQAIVVDDLPENIRRYHRHVNRVEASVGVVPIADRPTLAELERRYVIEVLEDVGGNKTAAARILGFDRRTLYRKLARFERHGASDGVASSNPQLTQ